MKLNGWLWALFGVLTLLWCVFAGQLWWWWQFENIDISKPEIRGQWGDTFGALNALLSAFAFVGVMATLWMQQRQISEAAKDTHLQRFETTYFQILKLIRESREQVRFRHSKDYVAARPRARLTIRTGNDAFRAAWREMNFWAKRHQRKGQELDRQALEEMYAVRVHARFESTFGAYYRLVYGALDRLRSDPHLSAREKDDLGNLIRSQFTSFEALLAGYNALNQFSKDFDEIIVRFRLLKYARRGILYDQLRKIYPEKAFLGRDEVEEPSSEVDDDDDDDDLYQDSEG